MLSGFLTLWLNVHSDHPPLTLVLPSLVLPPPWSTAEGEEKHDSMVQCSPFGKKTFLAHTKLNYMVAQKFAHFWLLILNSMSTFGSISTFKVGLDSWTSLAHSTANQIVLPLEHNAFPTDHLLKLSLSCTAPIHLSLSPFHLAYPEKVFILCSHSCDLTLATVTTDPVPARLKWWWNHTMILTSLNSFGSDIGTAEY